MATTAENLSLLKAYWSGADIVHAAGARPLDYAASSLLGARARNLLVAIAAAKELVVTARYDASTRAAFASAAVFETALLKDAFYDDALAQLRMYLDEGAEPPRFVILDGILNATAGSWWAPPTRDGVTPWIGAPEVAGAAVMSTILGDPLPEVRGVALKLITNAAIPQFWATLFMNNNLFAQAGQDLKTSAFSVAERTALTSLLGPAEGRVRSLFTTYAASTEPPAFLTGNGTQAPTAPPPTQPWYKRGPIIAVGTLGLLGGVLTARARRL